MAAMLYLPRLFVYHCGRRGLDQSETFKVMERRLLRAIMKPAMTATWILGLLLVWQGGRLQGWLHAKLVAPPRHAAAPSRPTPATQAFAADTNPRPRFYRASTRSRRC